MAGIYARSVVPKTVGERDLLSCCCQTGLRFALPCFRTTSFRIASGRLIYQAQSPGVLSRAGVSGNLQAESFACAKDGLRASGRFLRDSLTLAGLSGGAAWERASLPLRRLAAGNSSAAVSSEITHRGGRKTFKRAAIRPARDEDVRYELRRTF